MIQPRNDRVLIQRIDPEPGLITLTDADKGLRGKVLAVGPGKWVDGELEPLGVKVGDTVLFNSKWNDFADDHYGKHVKDLPLGADPKVHLLQEADIIGILHEA